jgi:hypothetical protein
VPIHFFHLLGPFLADDWDPKSHYEPASSEPIHTGRISNCAAFWRTFVKSKWVMSWIENGYDLVWDTTPPIPKELKKSKSSLDNQKIVTKGVSDMLETGAVSALPSGVLPTVISPLGVVPKSNSEKLRLVVNMKYVNMHLSKRVFKFEGLANLPDMADKGDWSAAYDFTGKTGTCITPT